MGISAQTLQTPEEAQHIEEAGLGIGELAIGPGGKMTRAELEKSLISAGKMQTMEGGPAEAYGAMVGQLALSSKENLTADQMQGKMNRMFQIQQPGGFKNFGQAAQQYTKIQPLIQSGSYRRARHGAALGDVRFVARGIGIDGRSVCSGHYVEPDAQRA